MLQVLLVCLEVRHCIIIASPREIELLISIKNEVPAVFAQISGHHSTIIIVGDTTAVHGLTDEVTERLPGELIIAVVLGFVHVERDQAERDLEITVVEVVSDVPADLAVLLPFLNSGVEEG
jgi:nitrate reductase NapAB chaperone NapD